MSLTYRTENTLGTENVLSPNAFLESRLKVTSKTIYIMQNVDI